MKNKRGTEKFCFLEKHEREQKWNEKRHEHKGHDTITRSKTKGREDQIWPKDFQIYFYTTKTCSKETETNKNKKSFL